MDRSAAADAREARQGKIGAALSRHLEILRAKGRLGQTVGVLVLIRGQVTVPVRARLEAAGLSIRAVAGEVVSGDIGAADLSDLAQLDEVRLIELPGRFRVTPPPIDPGPTP